MTKTTNRNNEFQAVLMEMMRNNGMTSNSPLVLTEMPGTGEIIIGKKQYFPPASKAPTEPNRTIYHLYNNYAGENNFLSLTPDQHRLLKWLFQKDFIDNDWEWEEMGQIKIEEI